MPARSGTNRLKVSVEGNMDRARRIPDWLESGQRRSLERAGELLREDVQAAAPGGEGGSIGESVRAIALSSSRLELVSSHPGAKALEQGAFIRSSRGLGTAIRFNAGGRDVFVRYPRGTRLPKLQWFRKGLRRRRKRIEQAFNEAFDRMP